MKQTNMNLAQVKELAVALKEIDDSTRTIYEIDTQIFLVEPILQLAGWDINSPDDIRRASRSASKQEFDIELLCNGELKIAIEVKAIGSKEYNPEKIGTVGKLKDDFSNYDKDGIGQIRSYCHRYNHFNHNVLAVLTNGLEWVVFENKYFTNNPHNPVQENSIVKKASITDDGFKDNIIEAFLANNYK